MEKVEKLKITGLLGSVRLRLGAKDVEDESQDGEINLMTNTELMEAWCGYHLGEGSWWTDMKADFDKLEKLK